MSANMNQTFSSMTGAQQTMSSWARVIDSVELVPEMHKNAYQALLGNRNTLPYTLLAPAQVSPSGRKSDEKLLCEIGDTLYILQGSAAQVEPTGFRYADICSLELGNILLYSWFSIHGRTITGDDAALTVEFNEATLRHFEPFFRKMRASPAGIDPAGLEKEQAKFDDLSGINFKYMNFARQCLLPGESVIQFLYQPTNRQPVVTLLGRSLYRTLSLAHLTLLTDKEVILIGEAERVTESKKGKYGGVLVYLPLRSLVSVSLQEQSNGLLRLTFQTSANAQAERLFDAVHLGEVEALKKAIESRIG
jgi:hypothetical protein